MNSSNAEMVATLSPRRTKINEKSVFDIENDSDGSSKYQNTDNVDNNKAVLGRFNDTVVVADILKTLFLILLWYTFSTFLTLYNKTLLGDHMMKFPAPLLMNTIHFSMQAVLSKGIVYFWSKKFEPAVTMSWKDYFMRDPL